MEGDGGLHSVVVLTEWISIHALRVEGDRHPLTRFRDRWHFYPRPPGGGRPRGNFHGLYIEIFLSTPSGWRATRAFHTVTRRSDYFYPRPPGGGRQLDGASKGYGAAISIHALRVEGDGTMMRFFPSTNSHFYPRPPGGGRLVVATGQATVVAFLSTPSGWRATVSMSLCEKRSFYFYPRPPGGGRPSPIPQTVHQEEFLSTPSGWRATAKTDKVFICFCAKGRRNCLFKTRKEKICRWRFKKDKFWVLIWCEGSGKSVCALASHCG